MDIGFLASDGTPVLLGKILGFTLFYAGLVYLPLRIVTALLGRAQKLVSSQQRRVKKTDRSVKPTDYSVETTYVIK